MTKINIIWYNYTIHCNSTLCIFVILHAHDIMSKKLNKLQDQGNVML